MLEFRKTFPSEGLWKSYKGPSEFEKLLRSDLVNLIRAKFPVGRTEQSANQGSRDTNQLTLGTQVTLRAEGDPPFDVDAIAIEDDTHMVLSADPKFKFTEGSPQKGLKKAGSSKALAIGSVVVRPGSPIRFLAIIHDLSKQPTWTEKSIQQALCNVFREAEKRKLRSIAVRALGSQRGSVDEDRFIELFNAVLAGTNLKSVKRIWIVLPIRGSNLRPRGS